MPKQRKISIGVGCIVMHPTEKKFLVTRRRKGSNWGEGSVALPGGHIEEQERGVDCGVREVFEETCLIVKPRLIDGHTYVVHSEEWFRQGRHHWTVYMVADVVGGVLANPEPHKHEDWRWVSLDEIAKTCVSTDWIPVPALLACRHKIGL